MTDVFPRVTVITPTYNRADLLPETIESVLTQGYPNLEYLILDDGSKDKTAEVVQPYVDRYPEVIRYYHHENCGEAMTVNRGWEMATGEYVIIINSDDPQPAELIARSVEVLRGQPDAVASYPDWVMIDGAGEVVREYRLKPYGFKHMVRRAHCFIGPGALINRAMVKEKVKAIRDPKFPYVSDFYCWLNLGMHGRLHHIPELLAQWRRHEGATTVHHQSRMVQQNYELIYDFFTWPTLTAEMRKWEKTAKTTVSLWLGRTRWDEGERWQAIQLLVQALRLSVTHVALHMLRRLVERMKYYLMERKWHGA